MNFILQKGNRKLPRTTGIFNLPSVKTCPFSTKECRKHCYSLKAERMYPQVLPFREKCLKLSKSSEFKEVISDELFKRSFKAVRIHESGDFYSQKYFDLWVDIALLFPSLKFYAYTKVWTLDLRRKPENFIMLLSSDITSSVDSDILGKFDGIATVDLNQELEKDIKYFKCPMDCKVCDYCLKRHKNGTNVLFKKH